MTPAAFAIARPRLLARLAGSWRAAVLSAPAGYGKTTLAAQFAARRRALWCRLHEEDADPARLLGTLLAAASHARPPMAPRTLALFESRRDMERDGGFLTASFLEELDPPRGERLVVLDDVHVLSDAQPAIRWLRTLMEESGPRVRFLLTCRGECPLPLARFETQGGVLVLRTEDLEFTSDEQAELLRRRFGVKVAAGEGSELQRAVAGWAAGLVLAGEHLRGTGQTALLSAGARSGARLGSVLDFLAEEVVSNLPADLQRDLFRVALLETLEPDAVEALLGKDRGRELLREIARRDLFVRMLPDGPAGSARFHPLLRDYLARRLREESGARALRQLVRRLARYWVRRKQPERAIRAFAESGFHDEAVRLLDSVSAEDGGEVHSLRAIALDLVANAGGTHAASPWLAYHAACGARNLGRLEEAAALAREATDLFVKGKAPERAARAFAVETNIAIMTGRINEPLRSAARVFAALPKRARAARGLFLLQEGNLRLYAGEPARARALLEEGVRLLGASGRRVEEAEGAVWRAAVEFTQGRWDVYLLWAGRALPIFRRSGYAGRAETLLINMAEAHTYLGEEEKALAYLDEARSLNARSGIRQNRTYEALGQARAVMECGRFAEAPPLFAAAREAAASFGSPIAAPQVDLWEGVLERRLGHHERALERLDAALGAFARLEAPAWATVARMERGVALGLARRTGEALRDLREAARSSRTLGDRKELARNALYEARVLQVAGRPFAAALRRALKGLGDADYLVALRKEADVSAPLVAAALASRRRDALVERAVAAMPAEWRARIAAGLPCAGAAPAAARVRRPAEARAAASPTPAVCVRVLGAFDVEIGGAPVSFPRRAAAAMIAYLALRLGQSVRREALAESLWPGAGPDASRNRFDVALNAARRALEPHAAARGPFRVLVAEGGLCRLERGAVRTDLDAFEQAATACRPVLARLSGRGARRLDPREARAAIEKVRAAAALYGGELLPGFVDAPWAEAERERVRDLAHRLFVGLGALSVTCGLADDAVVAAERVLADDPLNEEAERTLLGALGLRGDRAAAVRSYRRFARRLRREFGAAPSPETREIVRGIVAGE